MAMQSTARAVIPMIGDPVAQAATPALWNAHFAAHDIDAVCVPVHLPPAGLAAFIEMVRHARNIPGFVTTIPHKAALPGFCDTHAPEVAALGTANTVARRPDGTLSAAMFDGHGMMDAVAEAGLGPEGAALAICGAGAAGGAIAFEALRRGADGITLADRDATTAQRLAERLRAAFPAARVETGRAPHGAILVNASPAGSGDDATCPFPQDEIAAAPLVADAVTQPEVTSLLAAARRLQRPSVTGADMAAHQADAMRRFIGLA